MAKKKRWNAMPFPALVAALWERCGDHFVRADEEPPDSIPDLTTGGSGVAYGSLYVDWRLPYGAT
ncbi:hypothetical protein [Xanthobacter agilis]|uniref:Uncharacterized protein n=1 Tax=Xanthobacter agilis TaxID=47492 RepID=A0ABU0LK31_XANAG|nr:hypothetical protein [Xanthobacter agilis]MDQ0507506.1 hypothetical protein [Xanthobacter agilis]